MEGIDQILNKLRPLIRAKASISNIDNRIQAYENHIKELKKQKLGHQKTVNNETVIDEVEAWVDELPKDIVPNSKIREIVKALEILNK